MKEALKAIALFVFLMVAMTACQKEIVPSLDDLQTIEADDRAGVDDTEVDGDDDQDTGIDTDGADTDGGGDGDDEDSINDGDDDDEDDEGSAHREAEE